MGVFDNETMTFISQTYQRADAFLFGRRTRALRRLLGRRGRARAAAEDPANHQIAAALHEAQVPRIDHAHRTAVGENDRPRDVAAAIGELKAKPGVSCRCTAAVC